MTPFTLASALHMPLVHAEQYADPLSAAMALYAIDTPARQAAFLAQVGHESLLFQLTSELWGPTAQQRGYDARADLGNTRPQAIAVAKLHNTTPGPWWRGHGLIQVTGFDNHRACGTALGIDLLNKPTLLELPSYASESAAWFWNTRNLNARADVGDFIGITRAINGGLNGIDERTALYGLAKSVLLV
jgi:putative chitinase